MNDLYSKWYNEASDSNWGCPDWRVKSAYPASGDALKDWQWKWEFLRRNDDYRLAYDPDLLARLGEESPGHDSQLGLFMHRYRMTYFPDPTADSEALGDSPFAEIFGEFLRLVSRWVWRRFFGGYDGLCDVLEGLGAMESNNQCSTLSTVVFDYSRPITPQLERAERLLKEKQRTEPVKIERFRKRRENWPIYLRLLDARDQDEPGAIQIYDHLLNEARRLNRKTYDALLVDQPGVKIADWQKAAAELRDKTSAYI